MPELDWSAEPSLRRPIMVVALKGLFDAAEGATTAVRRLQQVHRSSPIASIDPEAFFDFTEERPTVHLDDDGTRSIRWPSNEVVAAHVGTGDHDLVLLAGVEPHLRWQSFADHLLDIARRTGAEMVVTVGAMVGMAPHTRPLGVVASTANPELATRLGLRRPSYEGPTGLIGVLTETLEGAGVPVISLRVSVPHYVPGPPNPEATRSLLRRFELATGVPTHHQALDKGAANWRERVDAAVGADEELREYVRQLEEQVDQSEELLPSGDDLAVELEAFLREQREE